MALNRNEKLGYAAFIGASFIWGFSFLFTKKALAHLDGRLFDLLSYRFVISALILLVMWALKVIKLDYSGKDLRPLLVMSALQPGLYFVFETMGINRVATSEVGLILAMFPIVTTVFGVFFLKERVTPKHWGFIFLSVMGVIMINAIGYKPGDSTNLGRFFLMMAVLVGSAYNMLSRRLSTKFTPVERTMSMMLMGAAMFSVASLYNHIRGGTTGLYLPSLFDAQFAFPILYLSIGCSLMAFFFVSFSSTHLEMSKTSVLGNTNTLVAVLAGVFILKEPLYWYHLVGGAVILFGVIGASLVSRSMVQDTDMILAKDNK